MVVTEEAETCRFDGVVLVDVRRRDEWPRTAY
jgi:hypothetical protein